MHFYTNFNCWTTNMFNTDGAAGVACFSTSKQDRFRKNVEKLEDIACWDCLANMVLCRIYGKRQFSGSQRISLLTEREKRQQLVSHHTNWFQAKLDSTDVVETCWNVTQMGGWRSWCSLFFHFQTGQISELNGNRWKTRGHCLLTLLEKHGALSYAVNLLLIRWISFKWNLTSPHHLIFWLHGACAGQELQQEIKKLEEEVSKGHGNWNVVLNAWW